MSLPSSGEKGSYEIQVPKSTGAPEPFPVFRRKWHLKGLASWSPFPAHPVPSAPGGEWRTSDPRTPREDGEDSTFVPPDLGLARRFALKCSVPWIGTGTQEPNTQPIQAKAEGIMRGHPASHTGQGTWVGGRDPGLGESLALHGQQSQPGSTAPRPGIALPPPGSGEAGSLLEACHSCCSLALQSHWSVTAYRNVAVKELPGTVLYWGENNKHGFLGQVAGWVG